MHRTPAGRAQISGRASFFKGLWLCLPWANEEKSEKESQATSEGEEIEATGVNDYSVLSRFAAPPDPSHDEAGAAVVLPAPPPPREPPRLIVKAWTEVSEAHKEILKQCGIPVPPPVPAWRLLQGCSHRVSSESSSRCAWQLPAPPRTCHQK